MPLTGRIQILPNSSLLIRHVLEEDIGYYLCQASNGVGTDISKAMFLTVKSESCPYPSPVKAHQGQSWALPCLPILPLEFCYFVQKQQGCSEVNFEAFWGL